MPELPEVETIRRDLEKKVVGLKIKNIKILNPGTVKSNKKEMMEMRGQKIACVNRIGKIIEIYLVPSDRIVLFHLKMTGQMVYCGKSVVLAGGHEDNIEPTCWPGKYTRLEIEFTDSTRLYFNDLRKFGYVKLVDGQEEKNIKESFGPEPQSAEFNANYLFENIKKRKIAIKAALLDQKIVAGIGNIYADEILFASGVLPDRRVNTLSKEEIKKIVSSAKAIIRQAIKYRGTTFSNYVDAAGRKGGYSSRLKVYGRKGEACRKCMGKVKKKKIAGRGTHFCEKCQN